MHWWKRGARWNDTYTGTWTTVDPITVLNDPDRANPYTYAGDNPINLSDPTGKLTPCDFAAGFLSLDTGFAGGLLADALGAGVVASGGIGGLVGLGFGLLGAAACEGDFG